eukprot:1366233-Pyramimonas_sp.AAC.1
MAYLGVWVFLIARALETKLLTCDGGIDLAAGSFLLPSCLSSLSPLLLLSLLPRGHPEQVAEEWAPCPAPKKCVGLLCGRPISLTDTVVLRVALRVVFLGFLIAPLAAVAGLLLRLAQSCQEG